MTSKTEISNLAISHLGIGKEIADIDTENSEEANACSRFYEVAKVATLIDHDWAFATKFQTLGLVETQPTDEWKYSYRYPSDCLKIRRIVSGLRTDTLDSLISYKILIDSTGKLIYTDQQNADIEYTVNITDPTFFDSQFIIALSFRLASYIAPRITGGDPFKMKQEMISQYLIELSNAKANDLNEGQKDFRPDSEFIRNRS